MDFPLGDPSNDTTPPGNTTQPPSIPKGANVPYPFLIVAGCFSVVAIVSSLFLIYKHLRNYTEPRFQKPIIRILFMVPVRSFAQLDARKAFLLTAGRFTQLTHGWVYYCGGGAYISIFRAIGTPNAE